MIEPSKIVGSQAYFTMPSCYWIRLTLSAYRYAGDVGYGDADSVTHYRVDEHWSRDGNNWNMTGWTAFPAHEIDRDNFWRHRRLQSILKRSEEVS